MNEIDINIIRKDFEIIADLINPKSKILDLGCANGELLEHLSNIKDIEACGIEISQSGVSECVKKGFFVVQGDIDEGLKDYSDNSFDYVILSQTLQVVKKPTTVIDEMLRVGKHIIISFPNFADINIRLKLLFTGSLPKTKYLSYEWYDSPNIHQVTIKDFRNYCSKRNIKIKNEITCNISKNLITNKLADIFPNLFAEHCIIVI